MEQWKRLPGFDDYEVSSTGLIRSIDRIRTYKSGRVMSLKNKDKKLRQHPINGFLMTDLIDNKGKRKTVYPHKAVAISYIVNEKPRKQKVVIHTDGNVLNNAVENLRWATFSESIKIGFDSGKRNNSDLWEKRRAKYGAIGGTKPMGRPNPVSEIQRLEIVRLRKEMSYTLKQLAEKFKCSVSHIHKTLKSNVTQSERKAV